MSISAAADGMGVALESTRLAEREITRGDLVVVGADEFEPILQEIHFLSSSQRRAQTAKSVCLSRLACSSQTGLQAV
jgi:DNA-binding transcriptional LysR family regulator